MGAETPDSPFQVRGYTLYCFDHTEGDETSAWYMLLRSAPEGGCAVALPDDLRIVFDETGRPTVRPKMVASTSRQRHVGPMAAGAVFSAALLK